MSLWKVSAFLLSLTQLWSVFNFNFSDQDLEWEPSVVAGSELITRPIIWPAPWKSSARGKQSVWFHIMVTKSPQLMSYLYTSVLPVHTLLEVSREDAKQSGLDPFVITTQWCVLQNLRINPQTSGRKYIRQVYKIEIYFNYEKDIKWVKDFGIAWLCAPYTQI